MNLWFDLKYAWRLLLKTPGHSLLCIVVVALSVGLALCSYALAYAMAFRPLPFPDTEDWRSLQIATNATATPRPSVDAYTYQELLKHDRTVEHLGAFGFESAVLSEGQASTSLRALSISPRLLAAMQTPPHKGRLFVEAEREPGAAPVVILSFDTWQNQFAADPEIVGKQVRIDGKPTQIVGVMPKDFVSFQDCAIWFPLQLATLAKPGDSTATYTAFVALKKGQSDEAAQAEMGSALVPVNRNHPELFDARRNIALIRANLTFSHGNLQIVTTVCLIALGVLLLGCVNVSMVFLARLLERSRELALRTAVGASRARLMRQCLLENAFVVVIGLLLGWGIGTMSVGWMQSIDRFAKSVQAIGRSTNVPTLRPIDFVAAVVIAAAIWLLSTLVPAWRIARQDASLVLAGGGKGVTGRSSARSAAVLVGLQITLSSLVLVVCANLVVAIREEGRAPMGVNPDHVVLSTYPTVFSDRYAAPADRLRYWDELTASIKGRITGANVAYSTAVPTRPLSVPAVIEHQEGAANQGTLRLPVVTVSESYFPLLGIKPRSGRLFDSTDSTTSMQVVVLDEKTAQRYWPGQSPIGKRIRLNPTDDTPWLTIVGVASAVKRPYDRDLGVVYRPLRQEAPSSFLLIAKLPPAARDGRDALRAAAFAVDRDLPLHNLQALVDYIVVLSLNTLAMVPFFTFITAITVIMSAVGLFGLISRSVARRTQEVGVRRALGGTKWQVTAVFLRQGALYMAIAIAGGCLGIMAANAITASIPNIMTRVVPTTLGVLVVMTLVIFTASYLPTRRAVALEPGDALRYE